MRTLNIEKNPRRWLQAGPVNVDIGKGLSKSWLLLIIYLTSFCLDKDRPVANVKNSK